MQHKTPLISELTLELINIKHFIKEEVDLSDVKVSVSAKSSFRKDNRLVFFIHLRFLIDLEDDTQMTVYHNDYLISTEILEVDWSNHDEIGVDKMFLAHLLGMSFLMVRGSSSMRLSGNILSSVLVPIVNPLELLELVLEQEDDKFILKDNFTGH